MSKKTISEQKTLKQIMFDKGVLFVLDAVKSVELWLRQEVELAIQQNKPDIIISEYRELLEELEK